MNTYHREDREIEVTVPMPETQPKQIPEPVKEPERLPKKVTVQ
jgi:hypothetical protein